MIAVYPGSFDPITYGHIDIIERAGKLYDELIILIMTNDEKSGTFSLEERKDMIEKCVGHLPNVKVAIGTGLTVDAAEKLNGKVLIRGIRAVSDYEYEMQLATANMILKPDIETVFLLAKPENSFLSSSTSKTIAKNKGDLSCFVPSYVQEKLEEKFAK